MITFSNLKLWNQTRREFEIRNIEVDYDSALFTVNSNNIDCRDFLGVPLGIDLHVHFREPGFEHKEDYLSGPEAALFGRSRSYCLHHREVLLRYYRTLNIYKFQVF